MHDLSGNPSKLAAYTDDFTLAGKSRMSYGTHCANLNTKLRHKINITLSGKKHLETLIGSVKYKD